MLKIIGFWYVLSGESWPLRPHTPISSPHSDPIFFSKVIKGHHLAMPKPGQEDPFLFGSFFPISDPHPNIHASVTLHCPTVFPQDFFFPLSPSRFPFPELQLQPDYLAGAPGLLSSSPRASRDQPQFLEYRSDHVMGSPVSEPPVGPHEHPQQLHTSHATLAPLQCLLAFATLPSWKQMPLRGDVLVSVLSSVLCTALGMRNVLSACWAESWLANRLTL